MSGGQKANHAGQGGYARHGAADKAQGDRGTREAVKPHFCLNKRERLPSLTIAGLAWPALP
jgi:hypothetical protein